MVLKRKQERRRTERSPGHEVHRTFGVTGCRFVDRRRVGIEVVVEDECFLPVAPGYRGDCRWIRKDHGDCSSTKREVDSRVGVRGAKKRNVPSLPAGAKRRGRVPNAGIPKPAGV